MIPGSSAEARSHVADRIFLLSPAFCGGKRARLLLNETATFPLAQRLREGPGIPIGEVFSFVSGLYFRGKLAYANTFSSGLNAGSSPLVITPTRGLVASDTLVTRQDLLEFALVDIAADDVRYRGPVERDVAILAASEVRQVILLGSIATDKYTDVLLSHLGERLLFPRDFVGRGDMSRGGLLLRGARAGLELEYVPVSGAVLHGRRPPRLARNS